MKFTELSLPGCWLIEAEPFTDKRGRFHRTWDREEMWAHNIDVHIEQANLSANPHAMTLRGLHMQEGLYGEAKTLTCITGRVDDAAVDMRPDSPTYLQHIMVSLSGPKMLHIPPGVANAFLTREPNTVVSYFCSQRYTPDAERGLRYDDPRLAIPWFGKPVLISDKDKAWPLLGDA